MTAPSDLSGVVGGVFTMSLQTSVVVALSIQAGLFTVRPGGLANIANVRASWYFELGWTVLWLFGFVVFYRPRKTWSSRSNELSVP